MRARARDYAAACIHARPAPARGAARGVLAPYACVVATHARVHTTVAAPRAWLLRVSALDVCGRCVHLCRFLLLHKKKLNSPRAYYALIAEHAAATPRALHVAGAGSADRTQGGEAPRENLPAPRQQYFCYRRNLRAVAGVWIGWRATAGVARGVAAAGSSGAYSYTARCGVRGIHALSHTLHAHTADIDRYLWW